MGSASKPRRLRRAQALAACLLSASLAHGQEPPAAEVEEPHPFPCCDNHALTRVVEGYLKMQGALARGEERRVSGTSYLLLRLLETARGDRGLSASDREVVARAKATLEPVKNSQGEELREVFPDLSAYVLHLALSHEGGERVVVEAHCEGKGSWLQTGEPPSSPYRDSSCAAWR